MVSEYKFEGIIPINRESIFEEESHPPTESTYVDYDTYKKTAKEIDSFMQEMRHAYRDYQAIEFLIEKCDLKYFLTSPVGLYNGKELTAVSKQISDYKDILHIFVDSEKENKNVFLYDLIYFPSYPIFSTLDKDTFAPIVLEDPTMTKSYWLFRYATLEK